MNKDKIKIKRNRDKKKEIEFYSNLSPYWKLAYEQFLIDLNK